MSSTGKTKKKTKNKSTTGTGKNTAMLGSQNNTEPSKGNNTNANNIKKTGKKTNEDTFAELEAKTNELKEKLEKINFDIETERNLLTQEAYELNIESTDKNFEINSLSSENKNLISQLKEIKANLDSKMDEGKKFLLKMERLKLTEAKLNKNIEVVEKQIALAQKSQQIAINDYNRIKTVAENNDEEKEGTLLTELEALESNKKELENENMSLRKIIKEHKLCPKVKANLMSKLNVLTNSYQFEVKKTNMLETDTVNLEEKKDKIKKEFEEKINKSNRSISYCTRIRKKVLDKMDKKKSEKNMIPKRAALQIANICNSIGDQYKKKSGDIKNINNSDYKIKQNTLFTENEQLQLASIIPPSYLNEFKGRFEALENQRYELVDKLKNNHNKHISMLNSVKIKLNYTELKKKEQKLLLVDLCSHLTKKNADITKLKTEINKINKDYNTWDRLLKMKKNENKRLNNYIEDIKKNKNKNAEEQTSGEISKRTDKPKKKKQINLQKQNNINFEYNNDN